MPVFKGSRILIAVQALNAAFVVAFVFWSFRVAKFEPIAGILLHFLLIMLLLLWRKSRSESLFFIPDEFIVSLPMLWALANAGSASVWFSLWKWPYALAFLLSLLWLFSHPGNFITGLKNNRLCHAIIACVLFIAAFLPFLGAFFPLFATTLAARTLLNMAVLFMSFPVSAAGLNFLVVKSGPASGKSQN